MAADELRSVGQQALAVICDVTFDRALRRAVPPGIENGICVDEMNYKTSKTS
jgi:hypothetical protein